MNRKTLFICAISAFLAQGIIASADDNNMLTVGGRYHARQSAFDNLPFGNGDISYLVAYNYLWYASIWQFGLDTGPDVKGKMPDSTANCNYVLTPQFNLLFRDRWFRGGAGIRTSYLNGNDGESKWLNPYWQLQLGLCIPVYNNFSVEGAVYYVLEQWPKIAEFRFNDLEYGLLINYSF